MQGTSSILIIPSVELLTLAVSRGKRGDLDARLYAYNFVVKVLDIKDAQNNCHGNTYRKYIISWDFELIMKSWFNQAKI